MTDSTHLAPRTIEDLVQVSGLARYSAAERAGLLVGDLVLSFGQFHPSKLVADPDLLATLKSSDWLLVLRGGVVFRLCVGNGLEGAQFEAAAPAENVVMAAGDAWPIYWGGVQANGAVVLVPDELSPLWMIFPLALFLRFRNWQWLVGVTLVLCTAGLLGSIGVALAYLVSVAVVIVGGPGLIREACEKQGYTHRGSYAIATHQEAAALEIVTERRLRQQIQAAKAPEPNLTPPPNLNRGAI